MDLGYTLFCEQTTPKDLVSFAARAEEVGYDFQVISDHHSPWLESQGHAPYAWSVLGAVAHVTERTPLYSYVTCPTYRYHPAVVAQKAATVALMSDGRFTLGLGAGENLNEHVTGQGWPPADVRHERFRDALEIITRLLTTDGYVTYRGAQLSCEQAQVWDKPEGGVPIGVAVAGRSSCALAGRYADAMIGVEPKPELGEMFDEEGGAGKPRVGQLPVSFGRDRDAALQRAHELMRWFPLGWKINAELPGPRHFEAATTWVRPDDLTDQLAVGDDVDEFVQKVKPMYDAGYTHLALVGQIGGETQEEFLRWSEAELLPALRDAYGS